MSKSICEKCASNSTCDVADMLFGSRLTTTKCRNFVAMKTKVLTLTNGDDIRSMTDEALSMFFATLEARCYARVGYDSDLERFASQWLEWLEQEDQHDN